VGTQILSGTERHRAGLARPQGAPSRPSDLRRRRRTRRGDSSGHRRPQRRTHGASVGQATNLCLVLDRLVPTRWA
jgi:hypothetical protein